jgi:hypothetical protein
VQDACQCLARDGAGVGGRGLQINASGGGGAGPDALCLTGAIIAGMAGFTAREPPPSGSLQGG